MPTCFVIQPFDAGKFDKRFDDVYKPAIEAVGLEAYRVDRDPGVEVPIDAIEEGIRSAAVCLADITTDNPNVWYELGFAFASNRPVVMVCSDERPKGKFPFDIQHRSIIMYVSESPSDFNKLKASLVDKINALLDKTESLRQLAESDPIATTEGLTQHELIVIAVLAGETGDPGSKTSLFSLKHDVKLAGLTSIGFALALRRLIKKKFIETDEAAETNNFGEPYTVVCLTDLAWGWIDKNESLFNLRKYNVNDDQNVDESIPF